MTDATAYQLGAYALVSGTATSAKATQAAVMVLGAAETSNGTYDTYAFQLGAYALVSGQVDTPHIRAWTFSLDGHDFYVLRLADMWTMALDLATGQWSEWSGHSLPYWRAVKGQNWLGVGPDTMNRLWGTNVVAGDDRAGILWMLDPTAGIDDAASSGDAAIPFTRSVTALVPAKMRETRQVGAIYVNLSLGEPTTGASADVTLRYSDNWGKSYTSVGTVTVTSGDYTQEVAYRSLGIIRAPGRIFELVDQGAAVRINAVEMK